MSGLWFILLHRGSCRLHFRMWRTFGYTHFCMVAMELLLGPQPLVRPVFTQHGTENMDIEECADGRERAASVDSSEGAEYERKDYVEIKYARALDASKSPASGDESRLASGNYRAELKRPDLKGSFRCSICAKVFCHSSSLSRHRMQAHFKSYKCTLCRKDITSKCVSICELR
ncbi:unnamed protein product [Haemonchus placei]|uniref:C2H2-type domain-containing protein n=1 Tax=Haemonchus placei TaxID=6290 RepID=A0A0N4WAE4_HAEPC|nr:unnamed protein product [Haemonchus placei]